MLAPGSTIGIIGGGQLGRMLAMAAARLGYGTVVLDPAGDCPAAQVAGQQIVGAYDDRESLARLATVADVVTYEFENVPVEPLRAIAGRVPVFPPLDALEIAQDRVVEKAFLNGIGVATAEWRSIDDARELAHGLAEFGGEGILKTRRFGYDGKGQATIRAGGGSADAFEALGGVAAILERRIRFAFELSVIAARGRDGTLAAYDPSRNVHRLGILRTSAVPGDISAELAERALDVARNILTRLNYVGVIGVEMFALADGALLVNEIAPRVHNSGHWTEAAASVSQFEQHVRAIAGLPLGSVARLSDCVMENLIGEEVAKSAALLAQPDLVLHIYGKKDVIADRKMGHFTRLTGPARSSP